MEKGGAMSSNGTAARRRRRRWPFAMVALLVVLAALAGAALWWLAPAQATPEARVALVSNESVQVETNRWLAFRPLGGAVTTGFILYPGGKVEPAAYAPLAREIAAAGYQVVIVSMPFNLAVLNPDAAAGVIVAYPEIKRWLVGGHSLGGAMAARFARTHPDLIQGLILWAAYPDAADNLSQSGLKVVSIYGTRDGLATPAKIEASRPLLPPDTTWVAIEGGNHAQFGHYGPQAGDNPPLVSAEEQQARIVAATVDLLQRTEVGR